MFFPSFASCEIRKKNRVELIMSDERTVRSMRNSYVKKSAGMGILIIFREKADGRRRKSSRDTNTRGSNIIQSARVEGTLCHYKEDIRAKLLWYCMTRLPNVGMTLTVTKISGAFFFAVIPSIVVPGVTSERNCGLTGNSFGKINA